MRLTHLKLAGFKSFVDPTTLHIHGQRVGVVGPNGCGKSNVMESVRWVLGESSAKEMRADSMDAVIFNGSSNRKAISRASVELIFDNSLGGASGEWSQYAEIAVKRVIERDKGSSYFINNTAVRRRDVADLFLGTGLGGRAYAIIGQNTISRIVEAKPDEMRVFLEEAAGISKYKERRRETELRLRDTRENLTRVEDIRQELDKQISRLEAQAVVAEEYHKLQTKLKHTQGQLWLLKKRDASLAWEKAQRQVEKMVNELEAQMAALRNTESGLETLRQQHHASTAQVQTAQTAYYEANAEVSNLEQQVKHTVEARERLNMQLQQIEQQQQKLETQAETLQASLKQLNADQLAAEQSELDVQAHLLQIRQVLPECEQQAKAAQKAHQEAQKVLTDAEQSIRLDAANLDHVSRTLNEAQQRLQRLEQEIAQLVLPSEDTITEKRSAFVLAQTNMQAAEKQLAVLREQEQLQLDNIKALRDAQLQEQRQLAQLEAQINSLSKIQQSLAGAQSANANAQMQQWLNSAGLNKSARFWQKITIESGWETALESVLGAKLNAIVSETELAVSGRPSNALVLCQIGANAKLAQHPNLQALSSVLQKTPPELTGLLSDWLTGVYLLADGADVAQARQQLDAGELLVNRHGDIYTRYSVAYYAAQSELHGVLERQRELDGLQEQLPQLQAALKAKTEALLNAEQGLQQTRQAYQQEQQALRAVTQAQHQLNLEIERLEQQKSHVLDKQANLKQEQQSLASRISSLKDEFQQKQTALQNLRASLVGLQQSREQLFRSRQSAETTLQKQRDMLVAEERLAQEKQFNKKLISNNINDIKSRVNNILEEKQSLVLRKNEAKAMLEASKMEGLKANLEAALNVKLQREEALAQARNAMVTTEQALQMQERQRLQNEQLLHPLRDKLEQSRLSEQQARLHFEQCQTEFEGVGLDEASLSEGLAANAKVNDFESKSEALKHDIEALGAVNLAAIQELAAERERKFYLDSQAQDLEQASATLEDAIKRIDKETRSRLQQTFDEANRHFGELFSVLFDGGQARLELLGDEILDTGMQVFAQPPGKKNSTIHLLSGGEKALTALALVFALFKLNPAPFCLMDEVDAPLDDSNTERFCNMVQKMSEKTQFLFISHNKITMEMAQQLIGVTMQESGVSRIVEVDVAAALRMHQTSIA